MNTWTLEKEYGRQRVSNPNNSYHLKHLLGVKYLMYKYITINLT